MTFAEATAKTAALIAAVTEEADIEARAMVCAAANIEYRDYPLFRDVVFPKKYAEILGQYSEERLKNTPIQYILGEWEFMGLTFCTRPCALIPRQDTETLCEEALSFGGDSVLDMCCGTGCIGISLAKLGGMKAAFSDISPDCIALARENAALNGVEGEFFLGDLFENVTGKYFLICSNPPYIPSGDIPSLQKEVQNEPMLALDGGDDGLDIYRRIAQQYKDYLLPGGHLLLEVGKDQAQDVMAIFGGGYAVKDLCGVERVVVV